MKRLRTAASGLTVVGASAGSGKTHRLTGEVQRALLGDGAAPGIDPEGLVAVTYTKRAQVELESRIRRALLGSGDPKRAARMPVAYLGTVHAVCLRWVKEYALDAGVSPDVRVLADDGLTLTQVLEESIPEEMRSELDAVAERLEIKKDTRTGHVHWDDPVFDIVELARHGRIPGEQLAAMALRSVEEYASNWLPPVQDGDALDASLVAAMEAAVAQIAQIGDDTKTTRDALAAVKDALHELRFGPLSWGLWQGLAKIKGAKASDGALDEVRRLAADFEAHPRFQADLRRFTELAFAAAARTLSVYADWKATRGLVDYVDMVEHALRLLEDDAVAAELARQLRFVVVDELQDSSPLQLALFLRLHALAGRSTWVGDPKQCIFEYAGADPRLMDAVLRWSSAGGSAVERLTTNWRSRSELVDFCNVLFGRALAAHGFDAKSVVVSASAPDSPERALLPPLGVFGIDASNADAHAEGVAAGIERLLRDPASTRVLDKETGELRELRAGDIAVLVATNAEAARLAAALQVHGIRATLARAGLVSTPEGTALGAALAYLLDAEDRLAIAELEALHGFDGVGQEAWLAARLRDAAAGASAASTANRPMWRDRLDAARAVVENGTPLEIVDAVLVALDLTGLAARWPDPQQRLANLDALRKFARVYETRCADSGEAASLSGLLRFLATLTRARYRHGDESRADEQFTGGDATGVTLITYHRSKGLEWPVVILSSLDRGPKRSALEVSPESDSAELDPDQPLAGRWIRYWPRPYQTGRNGVFTARIDASAAGVRVAERERRERARLLYVGFTRARDHLILAVSVGRSGPKTKWLDELAHADGKTILRLSGEPSASAIELCDEDGGATAFRARVWRVTAPEPRAQEESALRSWFSTTTPGGRPPYWVQPSAAASAGLSLPALAVKALHRLHAPLVRADGAKVEWQRVGDAIHAFLAADTPGLQSKARRLRATRLLAAHEVTTYGADALVQAADAFRAFVDAYVPGATWRREIPVEAAIDTPAGERAIDGRIDLLLETPSEWIIVDHKSFPGATEAALRAKAEALAPQLAAYALALARVDPTKRVSAWLHFATAGAIVMLT